MLLFTIGVMCNILFIVVFTSAKFRHSSTAIYLKALAVSDGIILLSGSLPLSLHCFNINITNLGEFMICKLDYFPLYGSEWTSSWLLIIVTIEHQCFISIKSSDILFINDS